MFELTSATIDINGGRARLTNSRAGALATFEGIVRNHNEGLSVTSLEYEAYGELALKEGQRILQEAKASFDIIDCCCVHRTGHLSVGDIAVWVGVTAVHRHQALSACQFIIDAVKARVPIWKKEHYESSDSGWINCSHGCSQGMEAVGGKRHK